MADPLAPATRCRLALADAFTALALPAYGTPGTPGYLPALAAGGGVVSQIDPSLENVTTPAVILTAAGQAERVEDDTDNADLVGYPVAVLLVEEGGAAQHDKLPGVEYWRHKLLGVVRRQRLPGVADILVRMTVEPAPVCPPDHPLYPHLTSGFTARLWCRVRLED